jgi:putative ABC transport system substrate-binding protein
VRRRQFIAGLGGAVAWPVTARAQQVALPVIGFISSGSPGLFVDRLKLFNQGLREAGQVEGRDFAIQYRWAQGQNDRLSALAADLVRRQVTVIAASGNAAVLAAKSSTTTVPIVFYTGSDPVQLGLVASLSRPGGNLTGVTTLGVEIGPKQLELLHELIPTATTVALLVNPTNPTVAEAESKDLQTAARLLGLRLHVLHASTERDLDAVFAKLASMGADALVVGTDLFFNTRIEKLVDLAVRNAVPAIYPYREFAASGGLLSYGGSLSDLYRLVGAYAGRIIKGEKPADLPVHQATRVEMVINLTTAKALGLTIPETLLATADEVIQ